jgi:hypothetical protein
LRGRILVEKILLQLDWVVVHHFYCETETNQYADVLANYGCKMRSRYKFFNVCLSAFIGNNFPSFFIFKKKKKHYLNLPHSPILDKNE